MEGTFLLRVDFIKTKNEGCWENYDILIEFRCHMLEKFDAAKSWAQLLSLDEHRPNVLMGVPTVYVKLIEEYDKTVGSGPRSKKEFVKATCMERMRYRIAMTTACKSIVSSLEYATYG